jgi:hypothetical protein
MEQCSSKTWDNYGTQWHGHGTQTPLSPIFLFCFIVNNWPSDMKIHYHGKKSNDMNKANGLILKNSERSKNLDLE